MNLMLDWSGFGSSSDGTRIRGINYESRHITLSAPTYDTDVDDSDRSTWTSTTRFVEVAPAIDHTAERQLEGEENVAVKLAEAYSESPLSARDGSRLEADDWHRKQVFQNMDHASDGKKKLELERKRKFDVTRKDLGKEAMDELGDDELLHALADITEKEIEDAAGKGRDVTSL
jgi:hypothetical protein